MPMIRKALESRATTSADVFGRDLEDVTFTGSVNTAGVRVSQASGARLSAAYAAIRLLGETTGSLPWATYRRKDGERVPTKRPIWLDVPNADSTRMEFVEQIVGSLQTDGNAFCLVVRDRMGYPAEFWPIDPQSVHVERASARSRKLVYTIGDKTFDHHAILHIPAFRLPGTLRGLSPIEWCAATFGLAQAAQDYGSNFFANGANPGSVIELGSDPGEAALKRMAQSWRRAHGGVKKAHLPGILTHGATWKPVSIPNDQAQFLETRKFSRSEIAGIFRVPPHMIGDLERATFSNIEHQGIDFVRHSVRPWLERIELRLNRFLPDGEFVKFTPEALLRGDTKARYAAYQSALQNGWMNANEVRRLEDLPPIGEEGDVYRFPVNLADGAAGNDDDEDAPKKGEED